MTDTDIRAAFERAWRGRVREPINESKKDIAWTWYCHGCQQGQRDLIEAMGEPVAYQVISQHGGNDRLYAAGHVSDQFLETERRVGNTVRALHFVLEVGE
ncbi:hypothetical protein [Advenella mimigardefordensis]|uniref:hypothetical protein n=1 Tax=Advenella mimigardefordensis TaxID=302406 RepID=UPI00046CC8A7|nr:hypothetical protein [Advenella mimigardefordensis]